MSVARDCLLEFQVEMREAYTTQQIGVEFCSNASIESMCLRENDLRFQKDVRVAVDNGVVA